MDFSDSPRNRELLVLLILLAFGLLTRFFGVGHQSLWIDEGSTFYYSHYTWDMFKTANEPNSPFYYMMEGFFLDLFGQTEFGIRFTSAVAGALTIPLAYLLSMKMFGSRAIALMTSALFLLSPICLFYGQEARGYMIVLFLFMLQTYVLLYALETKRNSLWVLFSILSALQFAMQFSGILGTFVLYLYALYVYRKEEDAGDKRRAFVQIIWSGLLFLLISSPLMGFAYDTLTISSGHEKWSWCFVGIEYMIDYLNDFLFGFVLAIPFLILTMIGLYYCLKRQREHGILLCFITLFPLVLTTAMSFIVNMTPRYVLWSVTGFYLAIPFFISEIGPDKMNIKKAAVITAAVLIIVAAIILPTYYTQITKEDFRTGAQVLSDNVEPGDLVLYACASENSIYASFSFYYDPVKDGIVTKGINSKEDLWTYTDSNSSGNIYVLILAEYDPVDYLLQVESNECEYICEAYRINVFRITGPLPH